MFNSFPTRTIKSVADKFEDFSKWLSENGIKINASRIEQYKRSLNKMADHLSSSQQAPIKLEQNHINTFLEAEELITVYEAFSQTTEDSIKNKISQIVSGPPNFKEEANKSNKARNTSFELLVASYLRGSDFNVVLSDNDEDMSFQIDKYMIFLECKRPMFDHSIDSNIKGAISQLKTRHQKSSNLIYSRGILAISLTRAFNPNQRVLFVNNKEALSLEIYNMMYSFFENHKKKWHNYDDVKTIGVLAHYSCVVFFSGSDIPYTTNQFLFVYISNKNPEDEHIIKIVADSINKKLNKN